MTVPGSHHWADDSRRRRPRPQSAWLPDLQESRHGQTAAVFPVATDDDVIQEAYSEQGACIPYANGEGGIIVRRLAPAGGMVMHEYDRGCSRADCLSHDQRRIGNHPGPIPSAQLHRAYRSTSPVEKNQKYELNPGISQVGTIGVGDVPQRPSWIRVTRQTTCFFPAEPLPELQRRFDLRSFGRPNSRDHPDFRD
jgi:hypothetical protein